MKDTKYEINGILFDLGSTLLEYENSPWEDINQICIQRGYDFLQNEGFDLPDPDEFERIQFAVRDKYNEIASSTLKEWCLGDALRQLLEQLDIDFSNELLKRFVAVWYQPIADQITIFEDTHTTLQAIKSRGKKIGLVSNTIFATENHYDDLAKFDLHQYFDFEIYSSDFGWRKPHPKIYEKAVAEMNLPPDRLLFVGDRYLEDVKGPQDYGINAILKFRENREYPDPVPRDLIIVKTLSELLRYIS